MKKVKINITLIAMIIGISAAFGFKAPVTVNSKFVKQIYGQDASGNWTLVGSRSVGTGTGQYTCEMATDICRAKFDAQPAQGADPAPADIVQDNGNFLVH